jgi:hypothetical protein
MRRVRLRFHTAARRKISLKKCCTKIKDAYKYSEDMDVCLSTIFCFPFLVGVAESTRFQAIGQRGDQSFASQART